MYELTYYNGCGKIFHTGHKYGLSGLYWQRIFNMSVLVPFQTSFIFGGKWALVTGEGGTCSNFLNWFLTWYNLKRPIHYLKSKQDRHGSVIYEIRLNIIRFLYSGSQIWKWKAVKHFLHLKVTFSITIKLLCFICKYQFV